MWSYLLLALRVHADHLILFYLELVQLIFNVWLHAVPAKRMAAIQCLKFIRMSFLEAAKTLLLHGIVDIFLVFRNKLIRK